MKKASRIFLLLFLSFIVFLGIFYTPYMANNILMPLALTFWLLLRISFLHIDQKDYWFLLIWAGGILILYRLGKTLLNTKEEERAELPGLNAVIDEIDNWMIGFRYPGASEREGRIIRQRLVDLLVSRYASRNENSTPKKTLDALQQRQIPLPETVYQYLFAKQAAASPLRRAVHAILHAPQKWVRKWTGREKADFYHAIEDTLSFIENSLEMKNGDETFDPNNYS